MPDEYRSDGGKMNHGTDGRIKVPPRIWIIWLAIFIGILLLTLFKEHVEPQDDTIGQYKFQQLVDSGQIARATINYNPQNSALNEVVGTYYKTENGTKTEVPFRAKVRLTGDLERELLSLPQFEPHEPNTMLWSVVWSVLPIVIIAVLIWFFFIRQIRKAAKGQLSVSWLHARTAEQQTRLDKILDKWEEQARRMDAVLDKMEKK